MEVLTRPKLSALRRRQIRRNQGLSRNVKGFVFLCLMGMATFVFFFISVLGAVFVSLFSSSSSKTYQMEQWEVAEGFPKEAEAYLPIYQEAGKKYGVPWQILAAIHKVETNFGRDLRESSKGAKGHTQFMDKTWVGWDYPGGTRLGDLPDSVDITDPKLIEKYGGYGVDGDQDGKADPNNPVDAIYSTAHYLARNYQEGKDWFARGGPVWQYNHDYENYVLKVKEYAESFAKPVISKANGLASGGFLWPVEGGKVTSPFGLRFHPLKKVYRKHEGIDIAKPLGSPIFASNGGVVVESRTSSGYGWKIVIDHGNGYQTLYAHMYPQDVQVRVGQEVKKGDVIAKVGSNGWSTGPHLHFEILKDGQVVDPMKILKK
ncbi:MULTISPECIES: peptidoglycan DD-metalloendopeptidase family protein [unclassified Thermoactinomyces]|uniref:peptidoglycan DD-metalloendopeptidase family protein n=1 Tax=unclassified Thermoactinomyces TaxID=2634588 RepID=UPI000AA5DAE0|nr:peptidoglycan DD-metalloendopeptidase family protein [Thermoactinomyces sp. AS95]MBI0387607.1 peptidoglycan DD-metalloendopeptidase family protein [Thermoactinomyces sp. CICC 24227]